MRSRSVQVYHMKPANTVCLHFFGHFYRIFVIHLLTVIVTLRKAYTLSVDNIYCRNKLYHNIHLLNYNSKKLRRIRSPTPPLFSGWNWVA